MTVDRSVSRAVIAAAVVAGLIILLSVLGGALLFSPVPFWDMWDGMVGFYLSILDGDLSALWAQHNEHRLVLTRLLFLADLELFDGRAGPLIVVNYLLAGTGALVFWRLLRESSAAEEGRANAALVLRLAVLASLFLWCQQENLASAFQSQFFLAQLLPLAALLCLRRAAGPGRGGAWFAAACLLGVLSLGSMANGVLALPLLAALAWLLGLGRARVAVLLLLSALGAGLYLHGYAAHPGHGSLTYELAHHPLGIAAYLLLYFGSPVDYLVGGGTAAHVASALAGLACALLSVCAALRIAPGRRATTLALLAFLAYLAVSALATAGGRLLLGLNQALSSRYTTPVLMAWASLAVLYAPALVRWLDRAQLPMRVTCSLLAGAALLLQVQALGPPTDVLLERKVALLALALQTQDEGTISKIYPDTWRAMRLTREATARELAPFGQYPWRDLSGRIGAGYGTPEATACRGSLDPLPAANPARRLVRVNGWLDADALGSEPGLVVLLSRDGRIAGYAMAEDTLGGLAAGLVFEHDGRRHFAGYLSRDQAPDGAVTIVAERPSCRPAFGNAQASR
jgi:hypothetical protein